MACLAMLLGLDYEIVLIAFQSIKPLTEGVKIRDVRAAAKVLGRTLRSTRTWNLQEDTGILAIHSKRWELDHLVVLWDGKVVDTDATVWDVDVFLSAYTARPLSLLKEG